MSEIFNRAIQAVKDNDLAAISTALNDVGSSVRLNRVWIENLNGDSSDKFPALDENKVSDAWKTILQASQTLDDKHKKKLSKFLRKKAIWHPQNEISG